MSGKLDGWGDYAESTFFGKHGHRSHEHPEWCKDCKGEKAMKMILLMDFDGVLHSYTSGWKGAGVVSDPPVPGAKEFVEEALKYFDVQVYSSRTRQEGGLQAMQLYLGMYGFPVDKMTFPTEKPAAFLTIDDRAYCFTGVFPAAKDLLEFKPWNKK